VSLRREIDLWVDDGDIILVLQNLDIAGAIF
jgi:hypothetical protein